MFDSYDSQQAGHYSRIRKRSLSREDDRPDKRFRDQDSFYGGGRRGSRGRDDYYQGDRYEKDRGARDPYKLDHLVSIKEFEEYLVDSNRRSNKPKYDISDEELSRRFEIYKDNFTRKQCERFFQKNKDSEWFIEKYHPEESKVIKEQTINRRKRLVSKYIESLQKGDFEWVHYDAPLKKEDQANVEATAAVESVTDDSVMVEPPTEVSVAAGDESQTVTDRVAATEQDKAPDISTGEDGEEMDETSEEPKKQDDLIDTQRIKDLYAFAKNSLFIKYVPEHIKRSAFEDLCREVEGFECLVFTNPRPEKNMSRLGWIVFNEMADIESARTTLEGKKLGDFVLSLVLNEQSPVCRTRYLPAEFSESERIEHDLEQAKKLAEALDRECDFAADTGFKVVNEWVESQAQGNMDEDSDPLIKKKKNLDMLIHYMHKVHQYDYYSGLETNSPEDFHRRASVYLRRVITDAHVPKATSNEWLPKLDVRVNLRISYPVDGSDESMIKLGARSLEKVLDAFLSSYVKKETEMKHRCVECQKLFKGDDYVKKHLKSKHPELTKAVTTDTLMFNAFMMDTGKVDPLRAGPSTRNDASRGRYENYRNQGYRDSYRGSFRHQESRRAPPPSAGRGDPRQIRSYQDLDAPVGGDVELQYD